MIIKGTSTRQREIYYPTLEVRPTLFLSKWMPSLVEKLVLSCVNTPLENDKN